MGCYILYFGQRSARDVATVAYLFRCKSRRSERVQASNCANGRGDTITSDAPQAIPNTKKSTPLHHSTTYGALLAQFGGKGITGAL